MKDEELMTYMVKNSLDLVGRGYGEFSTRNPAYIDLLLTTALFAKYYLVLGFLHNHRE